MQVHTFVSENKKSIMNMGHTGTQNTDFVTPLISLLVCASTKYKKIQIKGFNETKLRIISMAISVFKRSKV